MIKRFFLLLLFLFVFLLFEEGVYAGGECSCIAPWPPYNRIKGTCNANNSCSCASTNGVQNNCCTTDYDECSYSSDCCDNGSCVNSGYGDKWCLHGCLPASCTGKCEYDAGCGVTCNDCSSSQYCSSTNCVNKKSDGDECGNGGECSSGNCTNSHCCASGQTWVNGACRSPCTDIGSHKCENSTQYYCSGENYWVLEWSCANGCNNAGTGCKAASGVYYESSGCGVECPEGGDTCSATEVCMNGYLNSSKPEPQLAGYPRCESNVNACEAGSCIAKWETCGGDILNCPDRGYPANYVSHIDSCGGQNCGEPCSIVPTPPSSCDELCACAANTCIGQTCTGNCNYACEGTKMGTSPGAPTLTYPTNGATIAKSASEFNGIYTTVNMTWNAPNDWGTCDSNRRYYLCLVASNRYTAGMDVCSSPVGLKIWTSDPNYSWAEAYEGTFYWKVMADNGGGAPGTESPTWSYTVIKNSNPAISNFVIKNEANSTIFADSSNRNHICQVNGAGDADLFTNRFVRFEVAVFDAEAQALTVNMRWNGTNYLMTKVGLTNVYRYDSANVLPNASSTISVTATDTMAASATLDTGRTFKVWDCQVSVSGTIYDGSSGYSCATNGFNFGAGAEMNFNSLNFDLLSTSGNDNVTMSVTPPYSYNGGVNRLTWGKRYLPIFSNLNGVGSLTRVSADGSVVSCNTTQTTQIIPSAYTASPSIILDYSFVQNQDAWFQVTGGGINANQRIASMVPVTCANSHNICYPTTSRSFGQNENGLVISSDIDNEAGCDENTCTFGNPNNWGLRKEGLMVKNKIDYDQLLRVYYKTLGKGATFPDGTTLTLVKENSAVDKDKVAFVNGELVIDANNTVDVGNFLMVVARSIRVTDGVTRVDGVLVADNGVEVVGSGAALTINGVVYSAGRTSSIRLSRDLGGDNNNETPGLIVNYRPDLLFNMPAELMMAMERE